MGVPVSHKTIPYGTQSPNETCLLSGNVFLWPVGASPKFENWVKSPGGYDAVEEELRYRETLHLNDEWVVDSMEKSDDSSEVHINVVFIGAFPCPVCGRECYRHDTGRKAWVRGNDSNDESLVVMARVPWIACSEHGVHFMEVPWSREGFERVCKLELEWVHSSAFPCSNMIFMVGCRMAMLHNLPCLSLHSHPWFLSSHPCIVIDAHGDIVHQLVRIWGLKSFMYGFLGNQIPMQWTHVGCMSGLTSVMFRVNSFDVNIDLEVRKPEGLTSFDSGGIWTDSVNRLHVPILLSDNNNPMEAWNEIEEHSDRCQRMEKSRQLHHDLFGTDLMLDNDGNIILTEGLVLQDEKIWGSFQDRSVISKSNSCELYFEEKDSNRCWKIGKTMSCNRICEHSHDIQLGVGGHPVLRFGW